MRQFAKSLQSHGLDIDFDVHTSKAPGHAMALAREQASRADALVAVGGDGTLNEVINGALDGAARPTPPTIGLLAAGTANDFVKSVPGEGGVEDLLRALETDDAQPVDLGRLTFTDRHGARRSRYFVNVADVGIGAEVVRLISGHRRVLGANLTYLASILLALSTYRARVVKLRSDRGLERSSALLAGVFGNGGFFGSGLRLVPDARVDDGLLHCVLVGKVGLREFLRNLPALRGGDLIDHPQVLYHACTALQLDSDARVGLEADGEFLGYLPAEISLVRAPIRLLLPAALPAGVAGARPCSGQRFVPQ